MVRCSNDYSGKEPFLGTKAGREAEIVSRWCYDRNGVDAWEKRHTSGEIILLII